MSHQHCGQHVLASCERRLNKAQHHTPFMPLSRMWVLPICVLSGHCCCSQMGNQLNQLQQALPVLPAKTLVSVPWRCSMHRYSCLLEVLCSPFLYSNWYLQSSISVLSFLLDAAHLQAQGHTRCGWHQPVCLVDAVLTA